MLIDEGLQRVVSAVRARLVEVYEAISTRLEIPGTSSPGAAPREAAEAEAIRASLRDVLDHIEGRQQSPQRISNATLRETHLAVEIGVPLALLLQRSRVAQSTLWEFVLEEAHSQLADLELRLSVLRRAGANHFAWNEAIAAEVIEAYERQSAQPMVQSADRRRYAAVRALLAGLPIDLAELGHPLIGRHVAAVVWGSSSEAVVSLLTRQLGGRPLVVTASDTALWVWWPWTSSRRHVAEAVRGVRLPLGSHVAFGSVGEALMGFRLSHRQALEARKVAMALTNNVVHYEDVALEAQVLHDPAAVRDFVVEQLSALGDVLDPGNVLVETMRVYHQAGQNAAVTAQRLGVHSRTVAYRLRSVEAKVGAESIRRDEFAVALRLSTLVLALNSAQPEHTGSKLRAEAVNPPRTTPL